MVSMKFARRAKKLSQALIGGTAAYYGAFALGATNTPSLQGYTGSLNVPSAFTEAQGIASLQYSDAFITAQDARHNHSVIANFGVLPWLELGGRIAWDYVHRDCYDRTGCGVRDMSGNLKLRIPWIPEDWFSLAIGAQDLGGAASYFEAKYLVASKQFQYGRIDLGAGKSDLPDRYLDGAFGSLELQPWEWLGVIAEYDAHDTNFGLRLSLPESAQRWGIQSSLKVLAHSDGEFISDKRFFTISIGIPLGQSRDHYPKSQPKSAYHSRADASVAKKPINGGIVTSNKLPTPASGKNTTQPVASEPLRQTHSPTNQATTIAPLDKIASRLEAAKFENIKVGEKGDALYVALENNIYNRNEIDAIGVALKLITENTALQHQKTHLLLLNQHIAVLEVVVKPDNYREFLAASNTAPLYLEALFPESNVMRSIHWQAERSYASPLRPAITLSPSIVSAVATERNLFDYSASLQTDVTLGLWPGALMAATYNTPIDQSDEFERYLPDHNRAGSFYADRQRSGFNEYELQQTIKVTSSLYTAFHAGIYLHDYKGFFNQTAWQSPEGSHMISARVGKFNLKESNRGELYEQNEDMQEPSFNLVSYRYFASSYDVALEGTYGEFLEGDKGFRLDTKFWFGDTAISLEYKNTDAEFIGLRWTLPLTPRRDYLSPYGQIKGRENWNYGIQTRINEKTNDVHFGTAQIPSARHELERTYLNNDRLSPAYVKNHWQRLREAAQRYSK
ncbi:Hypothetical protein HDN1F_10530 [gamma proteobacterium HdN1]|nr:Hypothetical protein HDN1F_10530 [gamma proteobacterium HdN1]